MINTKHILKKLFSLGAEPSPTTQHSETRGRLGDEDLQVETNIPLPTVRQYVRKVETYGSVLQRLNIGDSVLVSTLHRYQYLRLLSKRLNIKITKRTVGDKFRIWRVK